MQRCREELDAGRSQELRDRRAAERLVPLVAHFPRQHGAQEGRDVEGGEDGHAVADCEKGVGGQGDGALGAASGPKHADEGLVFVDAEADVGG